MTITQHTPGPWKIGGKFDLDQIGFGAGYIEIEGRILCDRDGYTTEANVAKVMCAGMSHRKEDEANARLIASAPELLDVVKRIYAIWDDPDRSPSELADSVDRDWIRAAIAKATGGEE